MNYTDLSKEISYALRHAPKEYDLELDNEGWTDLNHLIAKLRTIDKFTDLTVSDIKDMLALSEKQRHEITGDKIRAVYGHSIESKIERKPSTPPKVLYHGTANKFLNNILTIGLMPKERQYVHLSEDIKTAICVGQRRDKHPAILAIDAERAHKEGVFFYYANEKTWLADTIPVKYLRLIK